MYNFLPDTFCFSIINRGVFGKCLLGLFLLFIVEAVLCSGLDPELYYVEAPAPGSNVSYNSVRQFDLDGGELVIKGFADLPNFPQTVLFEVTGSMPSRLEGTIKVIGENVSLILINPNGVVCEKCGFMNIRKVELKTDRDIHVMEGGIDVKDGSLTLSAKDIKVNGGIKSKDSLELKGDRVYFNEGTGLKSEQGCLKITGEVLGFGNLESKKIISVLSPRNIKLNSVWLSSSASNNNPEFATLSPHVSSGNPEKYISLIAKDNLSASKIKVKGKGGVKICGKKIGVRSISGVENLSIYGEKLVRSPTLKKVTNVLIAEKRSSQNDPEKMNFIIKRPLKIKGDFRFLGTSFRNVSRLRARNVFLDLKDYFVNDEGGVISANSIEIYAAGKRDDGNGFYQNSDSALKANDFIEIIVPNGSAYFGYKKKFTQDGDNKDGFKLIGSMLSSGEGGVYIQSGGDVIFNGMQSVGNFVVEAKGRIEKRDVSSGSYRKGTRVEKERYLECMRRGVFSCNLKQWQTRDKIVPNFETPVLRTNFIGEQFFSNQADLVFRGISKHDEGMVFDSFLEGVVKDHLSLEAAFDVEVVGVTADEDVIERASVYLH